MAPMQWPGTTGVLEGLGGAPSGAELSDQAFSSQDLPTLSCRAGMTRNCSSRSHRRTWSSRSPLCGSCAVRMVCLAGAIARAEPWGVWGGELFLRGEIVPRKRPRGRPRKDAVAA